MFMFFDNIEKTWRSKEGHLKERLQGETQGR